MLDRNPQDKHGIVSPEASPPSPGRGPGSREDVVPWVLQPEDTEAPFSVSEMFSWTEGVILVNFSVEIHLSRLPVFKREVKRGMCLLNKLRLSHFPLGP